ncbi:MAG: GDP-mannose 4,6-dehydratase [Thermoprotei archaeon]
MGEKILTGGAGFIGSHMVDRLVNEGFKVMGFDSVRTTHKPVAHGIG